MKRFRLISKWVGWALCAWGITYAIGYAFTPRINVEAHKPIGDELWTRIVMFKSLHGHYPESEAGLLESDIFSHEQRKRFLSRSFGHRKFHYLADGKLGPTLNLDVMPGTLSGVVVWHDRAMEKAKDSVD